jgi:hypothetical protein
MTESKCANKITIDGEVYVKVESMPEENWVIIRTYSAGVHFGMLHKRDGKEVVLKNARRIWYWDGAASLSQLAVDGTSKPENCKFPTEVPEITLTEAIEIIPCTQKAVESIHSVKVWKK